MMALFTHRCIQVFGLLNLLFLLLSTTSLALDKAAKIDQLISAYHEYGQFNGSVLVAEKGDVIFKKGYGWAQMEWDIPNESDTKFRLGSITKQFTAVLILHLEQEGKLSTDDPIGKHLPDYPEGVLKVVDAAVTFNVGEDGNAESLILYQNGQDVPANRVE